MARARGDHDGHEQRQRQQRHDQVARARLDGQRRRPACRPRRARRRPARGRPSSSGSAPPRRRARAAGARTPARRRARARRGSTNSAVALATNSAVRSTGASRKPSKPPCSRSATNRRLMPEHGREQQRHPQHARRRGRPRASSRSQREVEEHERAVSAEQRHRRHRLRACAARAAGPCAGARRPRLIAYSAPHVGAASTSAAGATSAARPGAQPEHDVGLGQPAARRRAR